MGAYPFWCDCGHRSVIQASIHRHPKDGEVECPSCGRMMHRDFSGIHLDIFQPYVDPHLEAQPVRFESRWQRDAYLKANGLTYDRTDYHRRPQYKPATDSVTIEEVFSKLNNEGPPKEELVQDIGEVGSEPARIDDSAADGAD